MHLPLFPDQRLSWRPDTEVPLWHTLPLTISCGSTTILAFFVAEKSRAVRELEPLHKMLGRGLLGSVVNHVARSAETAKRNADVKARRRSVFSGRSGC